MTILFRKGKDGHHTLTVERNDGSRTWAPLQNVFGPLHELGHYVVETTLGFDAGFFGLLASGRSIQEFEDTEDRCWIGAQGLQSEAVVMALQYELAGVVAYEDFIEAVQMSCKGTDVPLPVALDASAHLAMRERYRQLRVAWDDVPPGEVLALPFPADTP